MSMQDYARLLARLERTTNEGYVLRENELSREQWNRVQRSWNHLSRHDPKIARALRRALANARSKAE
jgi:hypothetical protein